jgi:periplasmic protein TonB
MIHRRDKILIGSFVATVVVHLSILFYHTTYKRLNTSSEVSESHSTNVSLKLIQQFEKNVLRKAKTPVKDFHEHVEEEKSQEFAHKHSELAQKNALSLYLSQVRTIINENKYYPPHAKKLGHEGVVTAMIEINRAGVITKINSIDSEYSTLKHAVEHLLLEEIKLPAFPEELSQNALEVEVPIHFKIR